MKHFLKLSWYYHSRAATITAHFSLTMMKTGMENLIIEIDLGLIKRLQDSIFPFLLSIYQKHFLVYIHTHTSIHQMSNHKIKLAVTNQCLRFIKKLEECIKTAKVLNDQSGSESFLAFKILFLFLE